MEDIRTWKAPYFESTCREVFDEYFSHNGFTDVRVSPVGGVTYIRDGVYVEIHYWAEDSPNYVPMIGIGFLTNGNQQRTGIGLWYLMREAGDTKAETWRFSDEQSLRDVLSKIRDEAIDVYARPFWEDPARLRKAVEDCYREEAVAQAKEALDESLRQARSAFDAGDYDRALKIYGPIDRSALAKSDLKRVELAKRKLGRNP